MKCEKGATNSSCGDFLQLRFISLLDEPFVLSLSLASRNYKNSSTILEFAQCLGKSTLDSANQNNPSLRADSQNLRGNPLYKKSQNLQNRLPRKSFGFARNDEKKILRLRSE